MKLKINILFLFFCIMQFSYGKSGFIFNHDFIKKLPLNVAPTISATGDQIYCPQTSLKIVNDITITDPDDLGTDFMYIQIATGYNDSQDALTLTGNHPTIVSNWNASDGKLKLYSPNGIQVSYLDFISAIKDVQYTNSSLKPTGNRSFSIAIGDANYLPTNGHFYKYVEDIGIYWIYAKEAAEKSTYYGLQGYLVTITSAEEQQLVAEQCNGTGWIAGTDEDLEGVWKWKSGPESGIQFFQNLQTTPSGAYISNPLNPGYAPIFAKWNRIGNYYEPNNAGGNENYAQINPPGFGLKGGWNDAIYTGDLKGSYVPKGYIIEYGGMPNDPVINIATSTKITIPQITKTEEASDCGSGSLLLKAESNLGTVNWFENETGGNSIATGTTFITPVLQASTTYYVETVFAYCSTKSLRTAVKGTIYSIPTITGVTSPYYKCGPGEVILGATSTEGDIFWYSDAKGNSLVGIGNDLTRIVDKNTTFYAEATNNSICSTGIRVPVDVVVYPLPFVGDQEYIICKNGTVVLDSKFPNATYLWTTGETTPTITVLKSGEYFVEVTSASPENCTNNNKITVIEKTISEIKNVDVTQNNVTILLENASLGNFEYSIDSVNFQSSNFFENVSGGKKTAYVRETNSCGETSQEFYVLEFPDFFTPNNDGYNDIWQVIGFEYFPDAEINVFDRFGKLLTKLTQQKPSWDGTFGKEPLPASDYWYVLKMGNTNQEIRGHFSLLR